MGYARRRCAHACFPSRREREANVDGGSFFFNMDETGKNRQRGMCLHSVPVYYYCIHDSRENSQSIIFHRLMGLLIVHAGSVQTAGNGFFQPGAFPKYTVPGDSQRRKRINFYSRWDFSSASSRCPRTFPQCPVPLSSPVPFRQATGRRSSRLCRRAAGR